MSDEEKHEWCKKRNGMGAIIIPPSLYDYAEQIGYDMRWYVKSKPVPATNKTEELTA